jgi:hypothetical protein
MIDHAPLPDSYYDDSAYEGTPLTDDEREAFRDEIRHLASGVKEEAHLNEMNHQTVSSITLSCPRDDDTLVVGVYLDSEELEADPTANQSFDEDGEETISDEVHYLRDMGDEWEALEYDLISELVLMLGLPEESSELANYLLDGETYGPCLLCSEKMPESALFTVVVRIPETTQQLYDRGEFELARRFNIPIDGAKY